jgi:hypothetical protein
MNLRHGQQQTLSQWYRRQGQTFFGSFQSDVFDHSPARSEHHSYDHHGGCRERKKGNDDLPERSNPSSSALAARFDSSVTLLLTTMAFVIVPIMPRIMSTNSSRILMREEETGPGILGRAGEPSKVFDNGQRHLSL